MDIHGIMNSDRYRRIVEIGLVGAIAGCGTNDVIPAPSTAVDSAFTIDGRQIVPSSLNEYIASHLGFSSRGGAPQCAYLPLGQDSTLLFLNSLCLELIAEGDSVAVGSGRGGPVALHVGVEGDSVRVRSHETPVDGGDYRASVRRIFPARIAERILSDTALDTLSQFLRARALSQGDSRRCYAGEGSILGRAPGSPAPGPAGLRSWIVIHGAARAESGGAQLTDSDGRSLDATWRRLAHDSVLVVGFNDFVRIELRVVAQDSAVVGSARATSDAALSRDSGGRSTPFRREWRVAARRRPCDGVPERAPR